MNDIGTDDFGTECLPAKFRYKVQRVDYGSGPPKFKILAEHKFLKHESIWKCIVWCLSLTRFQQPRTVEKKWLTLRKLAPGGIESSWEDCLFDSEEDAIDFAVELRDYLRRQRISKVTTLSGIHGGPHD